jgi:hypothetical protein
MTRERASVNVESLLEFLRDYEDQPLTDGIQHMTVCHGCGNVDYPTANCSKDSPKCDRVRQPMFFASANTEGLDYYLDC